MYLVHPLRMRSHGVDRLIIQQVNMLPGCLACWRLNGNTNPF